MRKRDKDRGLANLVRRQMGLAQRDQLVRLGFTQSDLHRRMRNGDLLRVLPSVYRASSFPETSESLAMAALLWGGPKAVLSHRTAGLMHGLVRVECDRVEVTLDRDLRSKSPWVRVYLGAVEAGETAKVNSLRVTNVTRTLIDLAGVLTNEEFEVAAESALSRRMTSISMIAKYCERLQSNGRNGITTVKKFLKERPMGGAADSDPEVRLLKILKNAGLPAPIRQLIIAMPGGRTVRPDLAYPEEMIAIEYDSYEHHSQLRPWSHDRKRRNELTAMGWTVLQATYEDLRNPAAFVRQVRELLRMKGLNSGTYDS